MRVNGLKKGISAALTSALFLGMVPVFGKLAIHIGFSPLAVIAVRTSLAALLMIGIMSVRTRGFFYIYPVGLIGCLLAGVVNGLGSILYYSSLSRIDASLGAMLYSFYPLFVALWLLLDRQPITRMTAARLILTLPAVILLILPGEKQVDLLGALMMLGSAVLYALHMLINQRILYEAPAQTVTLYTLIAMAVTVDIAFLIGGPVFPPAGGTWGPVLAMALITFFSRFALFTGIKHLGPLQTALLGLAELLVTVLLSLVWLGETLTLVQYAGGFLLVISILLMGFDKVAPQKRNATGWLSWLNPPQVPTTDIPWQ